MSIYGTAVVGLNYGDEGKGTVVHELASSDRFDCVIGVKHNGGSQAGHTVVAGDKRHVFNQYSSVLAKGWRTFIAPSFFFDPIMFWEEHDRHCASGLIDVNNMGHMIHVHAMTPLVTPIDVLENQLRERRRGGNRHGSCGHGIFDAFRRAREHPNLTLTAAEVDSEYIETEYLKRLLTAQMESTEHARDEFDVESTVKTLVEPFASAVDGLANKIPIDYASFDSLISSEYWEYDEDDSHLHVIYESGQGLLLGMNLEYLMPHLTPSMTNARNAHDIHTLLTGIPLDAIVHATRPYATRHGAGPMHGGEWTEEEFKKHVPRFSDHTNAPNEWQGEMRFGPLEIEHMKWVKTGLALEREATQDTNYRVTAVTCVDQCDAFTVDGSHDLDFTQFKSALSRSIREAVHERGDAVAAAIASMDI